MVVAISRTSCGRFACEAARARSVSSERTGMEGKAKAGQDSLTQAEEEDTSVQAFCADSCRQRMLTGKHGQFALGPDNQGRRWAFGPS